MHRLSCEADATHHGAAHGSLKVSRCRRILRNSGISENSRISSISFELRTARRTLHYTRSPHFSVRSARRRCDRPYPRNQRHHHRPVMLKRSCRGSCGCSAAGSWGFVPGCAKLGFVAVNGGFCFMVDRARRVMLTLTSKVWRRQSSSYLSRNFSTYISKLLCDGTPHISTASTGIALVVRLRSSSSAACFASLAVHLEIAHLKQHDVVRVGFLEISRSEPVLAVHAPPPFPAGSGRSAPFPQGGEKRSF